MAAFDAFQSEEAGIPDVPDSFVGIPDFDAAPVPALLTSGGGPQNSRREVDGQVSSGLHLHMMSPSGDLQICTCSSAQLPKCSTKGSFSAAC